MSATDFQIRPNIESQVLKNLKQQIMYSYILVVKPHLTNF